SAMWTTFSVVDPAVSVGSVQLAAARPLRVRAALIAVRSSTMCTAFTTVVWATSGLSVKLVLVMAKVAVTARAALMVTLQAPVPVQAPLQPVKVEPVAGAAVRLTAAPLVNEAEQVAPQEMPAGVLVTVQVPVPVQPPPLQPVNVEPAEGAAVKVTMVPLVKAWAQVAPQEMPAGELVTVPVPFPDFATVSVKDDCMKVAVTEV